MRSKTNKKIDANKNQHPKLRHLAESKFAKWLQTPNEAFGGIRPIDASMEQLRTMAYRLSSGEPG